MFYLLWFNMPADWRFGLEVRVCILHGIRSARTDDLSRVFNAATYAASTGIGSGIGSRSAAAVMTITWWLNGNERSHKFRP